MIAKSTFTRRALLTGAPLPSHHVSSAVVVVLPPRRDDVSRQLAVMPGVDVHASDGSRIVVTIEGPTSGFLGETLTRMSFIEGVISANMVFEHIESGKEEPS